MPDKRSALIRYFDAAAISRITAVGYKPLGLVEGNLVGNHLSPFHGFAIEFAGHRQYTVGDDLKHLDWKLYFKSDKLFLKQYEQETNFIGNILVDVSETMKFDYQGRRKIDYAGFMAVAIASAIISQNDMVSATFFSDRIHEMIPATGSSEIVGKISDYVEHCEYKNKTEIGRILSLLAEKIGRRKSVFVISDLFDDTGSIFDGIKRLLYNRNEVILLHVIDPLEMDFDYQGMVELVELEGPDRLMIQGSSIRESYNAGFKDYLATMEKESHKLGVDYILCDTSQNFGITLSKYMNTRIARGLR